MVAVAVAVVFCYLKRFFENFYRAFLRLTVKKSYKYFAIIFTSTDFMMTLQMDKLNLDMTDPLFLATIFVVLCEFLIYD